MLLPENLLNSHQVETDSSPTGASTYVTMAHTLIPPYILGGYSDVEPATEEIQQYCNEVKNEVEAQTNQKYGEFKAVKYRSNVGVGTGYIVQVQVNECDYIHLHLLKQLPRKGGKITLEGVEENPQKDGTF